ncbi:MAG: RNA polymerase sigma factor [Lacibacter sp.]|jgi:RNA polymerase sigma factor (sigma-70 family)
MRQHPDQKYIDGLLQNDSRVLKEIYERYTSPIKAYLLSKGCEENEAADIFQEALIDIFKLARSSEFVLTCPFEAFLLLICKRKFLNSKKKSGASTVTIENNSVYTKEESSLHESYGREMQFLDRQELVMTILEGMGNCKEIILKSLTELPQAAIAEALGMSHAYFRKRKTHCMQTLIDKIRVHPRYKELKT